MAKKVSHEKNVNKKVNLVCLLAALVLVVVAVFAYLTAITSLDFAGVKTDISADEILNIFEAIAEEDTTQIPKLFVLMLIVAISIMQIIALINVIRLVIGWFGFLGDKDSLKMAKKLSKHAKISFGVMATAISIHVLAACDNGKLDPSATGLFVVTGIMMLVCYLATRYYRYFVVEKRELTDWLFDVIRDVFYFAFPIFLFGYIGMTFVADFVGSFTILMNASQAVMLEKGISAMMSSLIQFVTMLALLGIVKNTVKFMPFDNYKRAAWKRINGKYRTAVILPFVFTLMAAITLTFIKYESFNTDYVVSYLTSNLGLIIKLLVAAIAVSVVAIGSDEYTDETKIAEKAVAVEAPASAETVAEEAVAEETPVEKTEESAEEAPTQE